MSKEKIKAALSTEVNPFTAPNYVSVGDGAISFPLKDIDTECLSKLCDVFRIEVFRKAGKQDPKKKGS